MLENIRGGRPFPVGGQLGLFDVELPDDLEFLGKRGRRKSKPKARS